MKKYSRGFTKVYLERRKEFKKKSKQKLYVHIDPYSNVHISDQIKEQIKDTDYNKVMWPLSLMYHLLYHTNNPRVGNYAIWICHDDVDPLEI